MSVPEDGGVSHLTLDIGSGRAGQGRVATVELEEVRVGGANQYSTGRGGPSSAGPQKPREEFELDPKGSKSEAREAYAF